MTSGSACVKGYSERRFRFVKSGSTQMTNVVRQWDTRAPAPEERRLRADARRNRERILESARIVFSESGGEAQIDDVARRAGVGVGTVYRHFPTKEALMVELVRQKFRV